MTTDAERTDGKRLYKCVYDVDGSHIYLSAATAAVAEAMAVLMAAEHCGVISGAKAQEVG